MISESECFSIKEKFSVSFNFLTNHTIDDVELEATGFTVLSMEASSQNQYDFVLFADGDMEVNCLNINLSLKTKNDVQAHLYGVVSEEYIYLSENSEDDAREKCLQDLKEKLTISLEEYDEIKSELSRRGVEENIFTITAQSQMTRAAAKDTYVSGKLLWQDDNYNIHPLRYVHVNIYDYNGTQSDTYLGGTYTDKFGNFDFTFQNQDDLWSFENGGLDIYIKVYAGNSNAIVRNANGDDYYYESDKKGHMNVATGSTTVFDLTFTMLTDLGQAFQISQAVITACDTARSMMGTYPSNVYVRYPYNDSKDPKCYYSASMKMISMTNAIHEYERPYSYASWDVIMHEYGHHMEHELGITDSPGGYHMPNSNLIDARSNKSDGLRLAWSESWATIFGLIAQKQNRLEILNIETVNDSKYTAYNGWDYDIETIKSTLGEGCEDCISAVLWDLFDDKNEDQDSINLKAKDWWNVTTESGCKTFSEFANRFYKTYPNLTNDFGKLLSYYGMAPGNISAHLPSSQNTNLNEVPPKFYWDGQGGSVRCPNNYFELNIYNSDRSFSLTLSTRNNSIELSQDQWNSILRWPGSIFVTVTGFQTDAPSTGGYISNYKTFSKPIYTSSGVFNRTITGTYYEVSGFQKIPPSIGIYPVTVIGSQAFRDQTNITGILLPSSIKSIEISAFENTGLTSFIIPNSVTNIGSYAFNNCNFLTIYAENENDIWGPYWNNSNRPVIWGCTLSSDKSYVISFKKTTGNPNNLSAVNGVHSPYREGYQFAGWYTTPEFTGTNYTDLNEAPDGILYAKWIVPSQSCIAEGTLITLDDGSQKHVEELTGSERLLVWNLETGAFDTAPILFIDRDFARAYEVVNLSFSDGSSVKVIDEHGFWDFDLNEYVFLRNDAAKYIGHWFNKQTTDADGKMSWTKVRLDSMVITEEVTTAWSPVTYGHLCYYVNGMLSMPGATTGLINIFDINPDMMKIDEAAYTADIEKYGLFTYEEFAAIYPVPEAIFEAFGAQYFKVAIGKGILTEEC